MKRIGFLAGEEREFINDVISNINKHNSKNISAEMAQIGGIEYSKKNKYDVIFDTVSEYVPFFSAFIRTSSLSNTKIINKNIYFIPDDALYFNSVANDLKIKVPRTIALPSKHHPAGTNSEFMYNLEFPLKWESVFEHIQFPALLKPIKHSNYLNSHTVYNPNEFFSIYDLTGCEVMIIQEFIQFEEYYRIYSIGDEQRIIRYIPNQPLLTRFADNPAVMDKALEKQIKQLSAKFNKKIGIDFNAIEIAVKAGVPYFTEFINIDPFTSSAMLKPNNYQWLVKTMTDYLCSLVADKKVTKKIKIDEMPV